MKTIWKFQLLTTDEQTVLMPDGAKILSVAVQNKIPCVWAQVDSENPAKPRNFYTYGTGHEMTAEKEHVGTYFLAGEALVFHVFTDNR